MIDKPAKLLIIMILNAIKRTCKESTSNSNILPVYLWSIIKPDTLLSEIIHTNSTISIFSNFLIPFKKNQLSIYNWKLHIWNIN